MDCPERTQFGCETKADYVPWLHVDVTGILFEDLAMFESVTRPRLV